MSILAMTEFTVKSLILLTTGRRRDLVAWEIKNQADYAGVPLLSLTSISSVDTACSDDLLTIASECDKECSEHHDIHSDKYFSTSDNDKFKKVLYRARFSCKTSEIDLLKNVLGNCILLRSAYEEEVAQAIGTDQLWNVLDEKGFSSSVTSKYRIFLPSYLRDLPQ